MNRIALQRGLILADPDNPTVESHDTTIVEGSTFTSVNGPRPASMDDCTVIDCSGCLIMPGLINAHCHGAMTLLRGLADDLALDDWLNRYIFPAEGAHANPDFVYLGTRLAALESVLNGTTTIADGYFHMEQAARAYSEIGIRAITAQGILDVPSPDCPQAGTWRNRVEQFLDGYPDHELVYPALFCHSPYLCGPETYREAHRMCSERGLTFFTHAAETRGETERLREVHGASPVEHLKNLGVLTSGSVIVHAVHLSDNEKELLSRSDAAAVHCPESNMKLASGAAPVQNLIDRGATVGLGTDGAASNNNLDMFEEMRSASLLSKLFNENPESLDAKTVVRMATSDGARALGLYDRVGSIHEGKTADAIVIDLNAPHLAPLYDAVSHLVYCARGSDVRDVLVNGVAVVRDRRAVTVDRAALLAEVSETARHIAGTVGVETP